MGRGGEGLVEGGEGWEVAKERASFPCTKCEKSYKTEVALTAHIMYKHGAASTCSL